MSESSKWKSKLLSSSAPMEYEVSKLLVNKGFSIHADYSYTRFDAKLPQIFLLTFMHLFTFHFVGRTR